MKKLFRTLSIAIILILLVIILAVGALLMLVSPNKFKPVITTQMFKVSGHKLTIDGDISWSLFPYLSFKVGHATVDNPAQFGGGNLAEIDSATIGVKLLPLLHSSIETDSISISGLKLNLIKNAAGVPNWQLHTAPAATPPASGTIENSNSSKKMSYTLTIPQIDINDAVVTWVDLATKQSAAASQFEFHAKNIDLVNPFDVTGSFNYAIKNPDHNGKAKWKGQVTLGVNAGQYSVKGFDFAATTTRNNNDVTLDISGDFNADLNQQKIDFTNMQATLANITAKGTMKVTDISTNPAAQGHLSVSAFDLKTFLQQIDRDNPNLQSASGVTANMDFSTQPAAGVPLVKTLKLVGMVKAADIQAAKIHATDLKLDISMADGILQFTSVTAKLYQGGLNSHAQVDLNNPAQPVSFHTALNNVQAEPLLKDLESQRDNMTVQGSGNITIDGTTSGLANGTVLNNLNGTTTFSFQNGVIVGINLGYYIDAASALIGGKAPPAKGDNTTSFGNLTGTGVIQNGILTNNDLLVVSPRFDTKGQGTIDLIKQSINYNLSIQPKLVGDSSLAQKLNNVTVPVSINGDLNHPAIRVDTSGLTKSIANQQLQNVKQKVQDQLKDKLPQAGNLLKNILGR